ncbi:hypothetical protein PoB_001404500 [Plakobranchus ocellatus]|uniref:Uncharacterized protein n=1 Tax=Plakobranchus ocellatus TaxID=259542 RepID=A0AAV3YXC7_9GAST|nr:hypothetical protein PoB_001404500 [Plakobranchus ocellatus]
MYSSLLIYSMDPISTPGSSLFIHPGEHKPLKNTFFAHGTRSSDEFSRCFESVCRGHFRTSRLYNQLKGCAENACHTLPLCLLCASKERRGIKASKKCAENACETRLLCQYLKADTSADENCL